MSDAATKQVDYSRARRLVKPRRGAAAVSPQIISGSLRALDFCNILLAGNFAFALYLNAVLGGRDTYDQYLLTSVLAAILFLVGLQRAGGYRLRELMHLRRQTGQVGLVWLATVAALAAVAFIGKVGDAYSRGWVVTWTALAYSQMTATRAGLRLLLHRWSRQGRLSRNVAVVGAGNIGEQFIVKLRASYDADLVIVGVFDDRRTRVPSVVAGIPLLGTTDDLLKLARSSVIDEVVIALPLQATARIGDLIEKLRELPVDLRLSVDQFTTAFPVRGMHRLASVPVLEIADRPLKHWSAVAKWIEDKVLSLLALVVLAPLVAIIAILIRIDSRGPVFFVQERFGFNNRVVHVLKFRTMRVEEGDRSGARRTVRNDPRVTRIGTVLRALSLDELPQLINVLRGDMSLVGPRPHAIAMKADDRLYNEAVSDYFRRHRVRPGMTGWAQVNGLRGEIDSIEKARQRVVYDLWYIDNWSLWLDLKILLMTVRVLLLRENAY